MAMMPKAPGLFSITNGCPRIGRICSPTMRMTMSVALPGPNGTMTLTGLPGYLSCASASIPGVASSSAEATVKPKRIIAILPRGFAVCVTLPGSGAPRKRKAASGLRKKQPPGVTGRLSAADPQRGSVHLDLHLAGDLLPLVDLASEPRLRLGRRGARRRLDQLLLEGLLDGLALQRLADRLV